MSYNVRVYHNTGLNAVNIIDKPSRLNDDSLFVFSSVPAIDILQNIFLGSVKVKTTWNDIKDVDYCRIGNSTDGYFYYFVQGVSMRAVDVAELDLVPDYITSAGGMGAVEILDGIITRCHISDDSYGAWNIEDEFLTPSEPLLLDTYQVNFGTGSTVYVESSLDLGVMGCVGASDAYVSIEDESVQVPSTYTNLTKTNYTMDGKTGSDTETTLTPVSDIIRSGINRCRGLGVESAVRTQVVMPNTLINATLKIQRASWSANGVVVYKVVDGQPVGYVVKGAKWLPNPNPQTGTPASELQEDWNVVTNLSSSFIDTETNLAYEYQQVNNKRVLYGSLNKVGILTTAGNRLESNPEETRSGDSHITIRSIGDPHPTGSPYHRFKTMNGNSTKEGFFLNAVKGLQWKQIPLMYEEAKSNILNAIDFRNSRQMKDFEYDYSVSGMLNNSFGQTGGSIVGGLLGAFGGFSLSNILGGENGGSTGSLIGGAVSGTMQTYKAAEAYDIQRKQEMQQFAIKQTVISPEISISYDGEAFRDFYGETVVVYRYRPTPTDIRRLDNILTMYGYKVNIAGKDAPINNRKYFNYLMGNITVGGDFPKWLLDGISLQVSNGVRIWHTKPSSNYYNSNPIK